MEVSSAGSLVWSTIYNGGPTGSSGIAIFTPTPRLPAQPVYPEITVTGTADNNANFTTIQYSYQPVNKLVANAPDSLTGLSASLATSFAAQFSNFPNPFHSSTTITYTLPNDSHVTLQVYNNTGKLIALLADDDESAGPHTLPFNTGSLAPGIYPYRLVAISPQGTFTQTKQMLIQ
jgi:hypothetical protein